MVSANKTKASGYAAHGGLNPPPDRTEKGDTMTVLEGFLVRLKTARENAYNTRAFIDGIGDRLEGALPASLSAIEETNYNGLLGEIEAVLNALQQTLYDIHIGAERLNRLT